MHRAAASILAVTAAIWILSACATESEGRATVSIEDLTVRSIRETIDAGDPVAAFQDLSALERSGRAIAEDQIEALYDSAGRALSELFSDAVDDGDYRRALALFRSAEVATAALDEDDWSIYRLLLSLSARERDEGNHLVALIYLARALVNAPAPGEHIRELLSYSEEQEYYSFSRFAVEELEARNAAEAAPDKPPVPSTEQLLDGMVTVWVNRGMRIEQGVGYPDRVIGSGFFIDNRGYIITNYHVVRSEVDPSYEGFSRLFIRPPGDDSTRIPAKVVGWDRVFDLALLKTELEPEFVFSPKVSSRQKSGDRIYAIGSPAGLMNTITSGIVSATGRRFLQMGDAMQVDVPINPGSSGGPLINENGELIGVVFAGIEQFEGINFAVPTRWLLYSLPRLYSGEEVTYAWLAASVHELNRGLDVTYIVPGSPAARAGMVPGDVITGLAGRKVDSIEKAQELILDYDPDTLIEVEWRREEKSLSGILALSVRPGLPLDVAIERDTYQSIIPTLFGMRLEKTRASILGDEFVVQRVYSGSIADEAGLSVYDPLTVQNWRVDSENRIAYLRVLVRKKKAGFLQRTMQMSAYLEIDSFL